MKNTSRKDYIYNPKEFRNSWNKPAKVRRPGFLIGVLFGVVLTLVVYKYFPEYFHQAVSAIG